MNANNEPDPLERLRRAAGTDDRPKIATCLGPGTWEDRQKEHEELMRFLHAGGNDPKGREEIERAMRRLRR